MEVLVEIILRPIINMILMLVEMVMEIGIGLYEWLVGRGKGNYNWFQKILFFIFALGIAASIVFLIIFLILKI